jgi:methionyl-tRNA formyltransferase
MRYILLTSKNWHNNLFRSLSESMPSEWMHISQKEEFTSEKLKAIDPEYIFIPHWSHIIPDVIVENYRCIIFHMTDLPFGRGGSPLQNLIDRGFTETKISAIRAGKGIDAGEIYLKHPLSLYGSAEEIFVRSAKVINIMIRKMIDENPQPYPQEGTVITFKRRKAEESDIAPLETIEQLYDYIRMLDCEGYPNAFAEIGNFRIEFSKAAIKADESILANVRITKK